jgi:hypothetical protein
VLVLTVGAAPADAKKRHKKPRAAPVTVVSASKSTFGDGQQATATATCPAGLIAVGGGADAPPVLASGGATDTNLIYESRRSAENAWQVSALRLGHGPDLSFIASVDCRSRRLAVRKRGRKKAAQAKRRKKPRLRVTESSATSTSAAAPLAQASATARCPAGEQALGGGFSSAPTSPVTDPVVDPFIWADHRSSPGSWTAALTNGSPTAHTLTSYAYCAAGLKVVETRSDAPLPAFGPNLELTTAGAPPCPARKAMLGGGFDNPPAAANSGIALMTKFSSLIGGAWQVSAFDFNVVAGTLGSRAYCA